MKRMILAAALLATPVLSQTPPAATPAAPVGVPADYTSDANWLCLPGRADVCGRPLRTVELAPAGYGAIGESRPAADPPLDCFYVYPTVSNDPGINSDLTPGLEEEGAAAVQFARFSTVCRPFAPIYRQITLTALRRRLQGQEVSAEARDIAYADVLAAWREFLAHRNRGRPFVLIGHSQGSLILAALIAQEIDGKPLAGRLVSAILPGLNVEVPQGRTVGGTFRHLPICTRAGESGCIVSYVSFRDTAPPPENAFFGQAQGPGMTVACVNPAALGSGAAVPLDSYWYSSVFRPMSIRWSSEGPPPAPFLHTTDLVTGACVNRGRTGYLSVHVNANPADRRTDEIPGDVATLGTPLPTWGIHIVDVNVAQGDLIRLVAAQGNAWGRAHR